MNLIPSDRISMSNVDHPVMGSDGIETRMMFPGEEHQFTNPMVKEVPVKGLFALMSQDMMANGTLPTGKPRPLMDTGKPAPIPPPQLTAEQRLDAFLKAHPDAKGTKWEVEGRRMVEQSKLKLAQPAKVTPLIFQDGGTLDEHQAFLKNWYENRTIPDEFIQGAYELDKPAYLEKASEFAPYVNVDKITDDPNVTGRYESKNRRVLLTPNAPDYVKTHEQNHYLNSNGSGEFMRTIHGDIVHQEVEPRSEMPNQEYYDHYDQIADSDEVHSRIMVLREQAGIKPNQVVDEKFLDGFLKQYDGKNTNINDLLEISKNKGSLLNMLNYMATNEKSPSKKIARRGGEMNKNEFMTVLARIAAKKAKVPMTMLPPAPLEDEGDDVLEYLQQGGQVPQEIIDMYLAQQGQDHWGMATTGFKGAMDDLLGSAYQTQRDKIRIEDVPMEGWQDREPSMDSSVRTAQNGAEVPAYIKRNRYRGYIPNFQNPVDLRYQGADEGLTHPGVIAPVNWGQSTLGSYDVKYRNPIWGKNIKRREHYEFYTPYTKGQGNSVNPQSLGRLEKGTASQHTPRSVPLASTAIDESPFRAQPYVNPGYITNTPYEDDGSIPFMGDVGGGQELPPYRESQPKQPMKVPAYGGGYEQSSFTPRKPYVPVFGDRQTQIDQSNPVVDDYAGMTLAEARRKMKKYKYLLKPAPSKDSKAQSNMTPGMSIDQTEEMLRRREDEYRQLSKQFKKGGSVEDRLKIASEFYRKGGMKC